MLIAVPLVCQGNPSFAAASFWSDTACADQWQVAPKCPNVPPCQSAPSEGRVTVSSSPCSPCAAAASWFSLTLPSLCAFSFCSPSAGAHPGQRQSGVFQKPLWAVGAVGVSQCDIETLSSPPRRLGVLGVSAGPVKARQAAEPENLQCYGAWTRYLQAEVQKIWRVRKWSLSAFALKYVLGFPFISLLSSFS